MSKPKCLQCRHYYTTFDPQAPYGCRAYRFRGRYMPSITVKRETGEECLTYEQKTHFKKRDEGEKELDLNDPKLW